MRRHEEGKITGDLRWSSNAQRQRWRGRLEGLVWAILVSLAAWDTSVAASSRMAQVKQAQWMYEADADIDANTASINDIKARLGIK